jgi:hypothetical protein
VIIDANLDCESKWSGIEINPPVLTRISMYGALLSVLAPKGEAVEVWTPVAFDRARWRAPGPITFRVGTPSHPDLQWANPAAKAANDRRLSRKLGALPGSFVLEGTSEEPWPPGAWVAKAVWSAAGRDRCRGEGPPTAEQRTRMQRLLATCGALVIEPWCDRVFDVGVCATVDAAGTVIAEPPHGLIVDSRGGFLGIDLIPPDLEPAHQAQLAAAVERAAALLVEVGYVGPFAIDAFVYRTGGDERGGNEHARTRALHVCEINARYTFGWVARAYARRSGCTKLCFGHARGNVTTLIESRDDNIAAWLA